jgi:YD repeat-containing protein
MKIITIELSKHCILALMLLSASSAQALTYTYNYDQAGRLTGIDYGPGASITYNYDNNGNLLQRQALGQAPTNPADTNGDGIVNILDAITILNDVNAGNAPATSDCNGDGSVNILDAICVLNAINAGP